MSTIATYGYDDLSRRTSVTRGNGVVTNYTYDGASRLKTLAHDLAGAVSDVNWTYGYTPSSQVITRQVSNGSYLYAPSAGTQTITRNGLNQPVTIDGVSASSDARGNLTSDGFRSFVYDSANRLTGTGSSTLSYDPLDRMTQMVGTLGARYLYDGDEIAGVVVASTGTTIANRIVRGPGADELLVAYQGNTASTPLWSLQDPQSSIIAITDGAGTAPYTLAYDEYGRPRSGNAGRLMYTGQLWMPDFGLYHYKARAYHPGLGRFVQTDPVGYEQGLNLYAYVGLDPMNATDPSGRIMEGCPWCDENGEIAGVENLPLGDRTIAQAYDGNSEGGPENPFYGADVVSDYATAYVFANVSAAVVVGGEAKLGTYAVTDLRSGEIVETGFMVGGVAGFGGDAAIGGGFQLSPGAPVDGITFVVQGDIGAVSIDSGGSTGIAVSPIPLPVSGLAGIQVQKHIPTYRSNR